ncbi:MAG: hypothetical protein ACQESR_25610 [Planctomycetota bacterium]
MGSRAGLSEKSFSLFDGQLVFAWDFYSHGAVKLAVTSRPHLAKCPDANPFDKLKSTQRDLAHCLSTDCLIRKEIEGTAAGWANQIL